MWQRWKLPGHGFIVKEKELVIGDIFPAEEKGFRQVGGVDLGPTSSNSGAEGAENKGTDSVGFQSPHKKSSEGPL